MARKKEVGKRALGLELGYREPEANRTDKTQRALLTPKRGLNFCAKVNIA